MSTLEAQPMPDQRHSRPQIRTANQKHKGSDYAVRYGGRDDDYDWARAARLADRVMSIQVHARDSGVIEPGELKVLEQNPNDLQPRHSTEFTKGDEYDDLDGDEFNFDKNNDKGWQYKAPDGSEHLRH